MLLLLSGSEVLLLLPQDGLQDLLPSLFCQDPLRYFYADPVQGGYLRQHRHDEVPVLLEGRTRVPDKIEILQALIIAETKSSNREDENITRNFPQITNTADFSDEVQS